METSVHTGNDYFVTRNQLRKENIPFSESHIRRFAPSVFAEKPADDVTERYRFYPTYKVLERMQKEGWSVYDAHQARSRSGNNLVTRHVLRFRHPDLSLCKKVGDQFPEIVLVNSHDKKCAFSVQFGIFRLVCSNGLIIADQNIGNIKLRHSHVLDQVLETVDYLIEQAPAVGTKIEAMQILDLDEYDRETYAREALRIKHHGILPVNSIEPNQLLKTRREKDNKKDLWTTYNVLQENITQGGIHYRKMTPTGKIRHASIRGIKNVLDDLRINKALWNQAETILEHKAGVLV